MVITTLTLCLLGYTVNINFKFIECVNFWKKKIFPGIFCGGYHYSLKMYTYERVRARNFARTWGFVQCSQAIPIVIGVPFSGEYLLFFLFERDYVLINIKIFYSNYFRRQYQRLTSWFASTLLLPFLVVFPCPKSILNTLLFCNKYRFTLYNFKCFWVVYFAILNILKKKHFCYKVCIFFFKQLFFIKNNYIKR